jgi:hypothetical protein
MAVKPAHADLNSLFVPPKVTPNAPLSMTLVTLGAFSLYWRHCEERSDAAIQPWIASLCSQ